MKSKQLNFFITPEDRGQISLFLERNNCYILVDESINSENDKSTVLESVKKDIFKVYLLKKEFLKSVKVLETKEGKKYYDSMTSHILEFSLGGFYPYDTNLLQRGRFYFIEEFFDENEKSITKPIEFIKWCNSIIENFKKEFLIKYKKDKYHLYSRNAIDWIENYKAEPIKNGLQWKANTE